MTMNAVIERVRIAFSTENIPRRQSSRNAGIHEKQARAAIAPHQSATAFKPCLEAEKGVEPAKQTNNRDRAEKALFSYKKDAIVQQHALIFAF